MIYSLLIKVYISPIYCMLHIISEGAVGLGGARLGPSRQKVEDGNIPDLLIVDEISCYISPYLGLCLAPLIFHESLIHV